MSRVPRIGFLAMIFITLTGCVAGCGKPRGPEVVVYCALDRGFSEPILKQFEQQSGVTVRAVYDTESTKSVGLRERLLKEASRPRCDVFWNNEILNTMRLAEAGALTRYNSPTGQQYPTSYRSSEGLWYGFAARLRILLVNTEQIADLEEAPATLEALTDPQWKGKVAIAKPLFGTTATHMACLFATWGPDKTKDWLRKLKNNDVQVLSGNKQVAVAVGAGTAVVGLTDTDDALAEIDQNRPVKMIFLESAADEMGMLVIPNTVSLIKQGPNPKQGQQLIDYLLTPKVEQKLATGDSGQIPLHPDATVSPDLGLPADPKYMKVDFAEASRQWEAAMRFVRDEFTTP